MRTVIDEGEYAAFGRSDNQGRCSSSTIPKGSLTHVLEQRIVECWPPAAWHDLNVVLAVSGGADSVALLRAMAAIKATCGGNGQLMVAHLNHGLRGEEADADAAWLAALCDRIGLPLETAKVDVASLAAKQRDGQEAAARSARYDFMRQTAERLGGRFVATAHTSDDQAETVLYHIVRGTGMAGLTGIPFRRQLSNCVTLVRPMLTTWRREIVDYLKSLGQDWRTDSSNDEVRYTRNRLRHGLLPLLRAQFNEDVDGALVRLSDQARAAQELIGQIADDAFRRCVLVDHGGDAERGLAKRVQINWTDLAKEPPIVVREVFKLAWREAHWPLQAMGYSEWQLLANMASGTYPQAVANLPGNVQVRRERCLLIFEQLTLP